MLYSSPVSQSLNTGATINCLNAATPLIFRSVSHLNVILNVNISRNCGQTLIRNTYVQ